MAEAEFKLSADDKDLITAFVRATKHSQELDQALAAAGKNTKKSGDEASKSVMGIGDAAKQGAVELAKMATAGLTIQTAMATAKHEATVSLAEIERSVDRLLEKENLLRSGARGGLTAGGTPIPAALRQGIKDATASGGIGEKQMTELMVAMQGANTSLKGDVLKFAPALKKAEGMVDLPSFAVGMAQLQQVLPELAPEDLADATMQIGGNVGGFDKMGEFLGKMKQLKEMGVSGESAVDLAQRAVASDQGSKMFSRFTEAMTPGGSELDQAATKAATVRAGGVYTPVYNSQDKLGGLTGQARADAILRNPNAVMDAGDAAKFHAAMNEGLAEGGFSVAGVRGRDLLGEREAAYMADPIFAGERYSTELARRKERATSANELQNLVFRNAQEGMVADMVEQGYAEDSLAVKTKVGLSTASFLLGDALGLSPDPNAPDPFANQGNGAQELKDQFSKDMKTLCDVMRDTNKLMAKQLNGTKIIGNPK